MGLCGCPRAPEAAAVSSPGAACAETGAGELSEHPVVFFVTPQCSVSLHSSLGIFKTFWVLWKIPFEGIEMETPCRPFKISSFYKNV